MTDQYKRNIDYMRVSITDCCNLGCTYCMPQPIRPVSCEERVTYDEITEICRQAAALGICKIKITGGEPLVREDCALLAGRLKEISGIRQVTLTTNGVLLEKYAGALHRAGVDGINVSLDTLNRQEYKKITGQDALDAVLRGIRAALEYRMPVKINALLTKERKQNCLELAKLARNLPLDVRFIEMMPIGNGRKSEPVSGDEILRILKGKYGKPESDHRIHGNGPAVYYKIPGFQGSIGFISAIHGNFCHRCNRIRLTCGGQLKPCLGSMESIPVLEAVRNGRTGEIRRLLTEAVLAKPAGHSFEDDPQAAMDMEMVKIGG